MSNNIKVYMKELEGASWTDVSSSCVRTNFILREGFGALGTASDVSKLSIEYKADDLASATLFHTSAKALRVSVDGHVRFEGYTEGNATVKTTNSIGLAWVKLSAFPYSKSFEDAVAPATEILSGYKVLDATDPSNSLVHVLLTRIQNNVQEPYRTAIEQYGYSIVTSEKIEATANPVLIEEGESYLEVFDALLGEFGLARYVKNNYIYIIKPYAENKPITELGYNDILINPSFSTKPYKKEKSPKVTVGKIVSHENDLVYKLRKDDESPSTADVIEVGKFYPADGNLQADYSSDRESDTLSFLFAEGLKYEYLAKGPEGVEVGLDIPVMQFDNTSALIRFQNNTSDYAYLNQFKIIAQRAYYKDTSLIVEEVDSKARDREEIESRFISSAYEASDYIASLNSESKSERFTATFESGKINLGPASVVRIGDIPFDILIRYREDNLATGISKYSGVAYDAHPINTTSIVKRQTASSSDTLQYISLSLDGFAYTYDADGNLEPSNQLIKATVKRFGIADNPTWTINGTVLDTTETTINVPSSYMQGNLIVVNVKVGEFESEDYIYKVVNGKVGADGKDAIPPKYQWRLGSSSTEPPVDTINHLADGAVSTFDGTVLAETNTGWLDVRPTPTADLPYIWERMSSDGGITWSAPYCLSINTIKNIEVIPSHASFNLNSRGVCETLQTITCSIVRNNTIDPCFWTVTKDGNLTDIVATEGDSITFSVAVGETTKNIEVSAVCSGMARAVNIFGKISGIVAPKKMNGIIENITQLDSITTLNNDGVTPLVMGDYALVRIPNGEHHYLGAYRWSGSTWESVNGNESNYSEIMSGVLADALSDTTTVYPSSSAIYGFFQNLAVNSAFIESLTVWTLLVEKSNFRCRIGIFNDEPVFEITYNNATVFKIVPDTGKVFIGRPNSSLTGAETGFMYDPATEELSSKNRQIVIDGDGEVYVNGHINATAGNFNGTINANAGYFKGDIETGSFSALMKIGGVSHTATTGASAQSQIEALLNAYSALGLEAGKSYPITINELPDVVAINYVNGGNGTWSHFNLKITGNIPKYDLAWYRGTYNSDIPYAFTFTLKFGEGQIFKFKNLPTTSIGLESGQVWSDNGTLKIV